MRYATHPVRPGLTAIAAVLALSSTPSFAQAADPAAPAPIVTPPPVVAAPAPAPVESAPATMSSTTSAPSSGGLVTVPIRPGSSTVIAPTSAAPAPAPVVEAEPATPAPAPIARSTARNTPAPAPRATATAPTAAAPAAAPIAAPAERLAPVAPVVAPSPTPVAKAPVAQPAPAAPADDTLPIAGGVGAAILLLGGGLYALNRRRRDDVAEVHRTDTVETREPPVPVAPEVYAAPVMTAPIRTPEPALATASDAPSNRIPEGFDTSRFGRHVQAAYRGPTPNNPFLSLKRRVKRASFYDMRERMAARGDLPMTDPVVAATASQPATAPRQTEYVTTRVQRPPRPGFRPAYQG
ncbi:hypothetical protein [Rhizorhabdus dicambivorans]|uniref:LPXTG cell wall anchor domain-containing protein n=1 Tax=Rhizorhabdus dicambivorans TaxID=1850238 RepID=A0A2A4FM50_9SPHN|nr:hypothetical protein [Rhizorhabdus dicambivorans]ATE64485.1 hypothetical protein CMV14_08795 [Rhizorhabdus dicambivorans]PCE39825.1 hypothetical protein COO09_23545 [Rhizorhabdus dicambivorans]